MHSHIFVKRRSFRPSNAESQSFLEICVFVSQFHAMVRRKREADAAEGADAAEADAKGSHAAKGADAAKGTGAAGKAKGRNSRASRLRSRCFIKHSA